MFFFLWTRELQEHWLTKHILCVGNPRWIYTRWERIFGVFPIIIGISDFDSVIVIRLVLILFIQVCLHCPSSNWFNMLVKVGIMKCTVYHRKQHRLTNSLWFWIRDLKEKLFWLIKRNMLQAKMISVLKSGNIWLKSRNITERQFEPVKHTFGSATHNCVKLGCLCCTPYVLPFRSLRECRMLRELGSPFL